jgi:hypothetical protein
MCTSRSTDPRRHARPAGRRSAGSIASTAVFVALVGLATSALAAQSVAVISVIGDRMTIALRQSQTGSNLASRTQVMATSNPDDMLDAAARAAGEAAFKRAMPDVQTVDYGLERALLTPVYDKPDATPEASDVARLDEVLAAAYRAYPVTRFVIITRSRMTDWSGERDLQFVGVGFEGLPGMPETEAHYAGTRPGHLAPFAALRATLVDGATRKPLASEVVTTHKVREAPANAPSRDPMKFFTAAEMQGMLVEEVTDAVSQAAARLAAQWNAKP